MQEDSIRGATGPREALELADWRRAVAELYAAVRATPRPEDAWTRWRAGRAELFGSHPQSPLPPALRTPGHLPHYFPYDPALRFLVELDGEPPRRVALPSSGVDGVGASRVGTVRLTHAGGDIALGVWWLDGYAGGLFLSFRDATAGTETYGGGRYLLDTAKGADLGVHGSRLVVDFNFAYQPSCSYDSAWSCPLPPGENWLPVALRAGERSVTSTPTG